jgi:hydrogenase maturation protein HypF
MQSETAFYLKLCVLCVSVRNYNNMKKLKNYLFIVNGIVQGVGFRPFIYNTALKNSIKGIVYNDVDGVKIEVIGLEQDIFQFEKDIISNKPPRAKILNISKTETGTKKFKSFKIVQSHTKGEKNTFIPPDSALCDKCKNDLLSDKRRKNYSFTNCVDCGPRFSITYNIPFDRNNTTMDTFPMCKNCLAEYKNPNDRRFHGQTTCCSICGPEIIIKNNKGRTLKLKTEYDKIKFISKKIKNDKIIAIKGIGGFHLAANPFNDETVLKLRKQKIRDEKPLALMASDIDTIKKYALINKEQNNLLKSAEAPITILKRKRNTKLSKHIFGELNTIGFMLAYTPLHYILLKILNIPLIMTSGNISNEPIITKNDEALYKLKNVADYFILHNRNIYLNCDDSVISFLNNNRILMRRSRGFVPLPFKINNKTDKEILAFGAEEKNTISIVKKNDLILSHHIGDIENYETYKSWLSNIRKYLKIYDISPDLLVADKHPEYLTHKYVSSTISNKLYIQHHYAHKLSLILDNNLNYKDNFLSFIWDGTGYGDDGNIWGGEILYGNAYKYKRVGHFEYTPLLTPEKSIKEPERLASDYLLYHLNSIPNIFKIRKNIIQMTEYLLKEKKYIMTSSVGRLFDVVSYLTGVKNYVSYSGQLAIELENIATSKTKEKLNYEIEISKDKHIIKIKTILIDLIKDIKNKKSKSIIAKKFHNTLVDIINTSILQLSKKYKFSKVGFSGGVFQNQLLVKLLKDLNNKDFIFHNNIPTNDGGISAGQALAGILAK